MAGIWTMDIPNIVFSRIVTDFSQDLKIKYKMQKLVANSVTTWRNFSTSQVSETPPIFPYNTIVLLPSSEIAKTLDKKGINGGKFGFQIDSYDNVNEKRASDCMWEIARILSEMGFDGDEMPSPNTTPQTYRMTARFTRMICKGDLL